MRVPGQIVGVLLFRGGHVWRWEIYDTVGLWHGVLTVPLAAPLEEASDRLKTHIARHWDGQELPGPWEPMGEDLWSAGEPLSVVVEDDDRPHDPRYDWPSVYRSGDVVRLDDGRLGVIDIMDYAPEPPSRWELVVRATGWWGGPDDFIIEPWWCRPAPEARDEARREGLL